MTQIPAPPIIVSTASLPAPLAPSSSFGMILGSIVPNNPAVYVKRRVQVNTVKRPLLPYAMLAQGKIDLSGGGISTDAFDSSDPMFSTFGKYDPAKIQASGDVESNSGLQGMIDVGNATIMGKVGTGAGGTVTTGSNGSVGDLGWARGGNTGIEAGWGSDDVNIPIEDVQEPFTSGYATPIGGLVGITPYTYILDGRISQKYKLSSLSGKVYVTGGEVTLWVTDLVKFGGADSIYIAPGATLKLYVSAPEATFSGNTIVNTAGTASNFQYYGLPSNKSLTFVGN